MVHILVSSDRCIKIRHKRDDNAAGPLSTLPFICFRAAVFHSNFFFVLSFGKLYSCSLCLCALLSCTCLRLVLDAAPYIRTVLKFCQDNVLFSKFLFKIFLFQKRYRKILCCTEMAMAWTTARYKYRSSVVVWPRPTAKPPPCHALTSTPRRIKGRISRVNMDKVKSS